MTKVQLALSLVVLSLAIGHTRQQALGFNLWTKLQDLTLYFTGNTHHDARHGANSENGNVGLLWGIPDVTTFTGMLFRYVLPAAAFKENLQNLELHVQGAKGGPLPDWLYFNHSSQVLLGVPTAADQGIVFIQVTATHKSRHLSSTQHDGVTANFRIHVKVLQYWSRKSSAVAITSGTFNAVTMQQKSTCAWGEDRIQATLVLNTGLPQLTAKSRVKILYKFAHFVKQSVWNIILSPRKTSAVQKLLNMKVLVAGPGNFKGKSSNPGVELTWTVGCGDFKEVKDIANVLEHNVGGGRLSQEIGYSMIGWHIARVEPPLEVRKIVRQKRQVKVFATPIPTPSLPTAVPTKMTDIITVSLTVGSDTSTVPSGVVTSMPTRTIPSIESSMGPSLVESSILLTDFQPSVTVTASPLDLISSSAYISPSLSGSTVDISPVLTQMPSSISFDIVPTSTVSSAPSVTISTPEESFTVIEPSSVFFPSSSILNISTSPVISSGFVSLPSILVTNASESISAFETSSVSETLSVFSEIYPIDSSYQSAVVSPTVTMLYSETTGITAISSMPEISSTSILSIDTTPSQSNSTFPQLTTSVMSTSLVVIPDRSSEVMFTSEVYGVSSSIYIPYMTTESSFLPISSMTEYFFSSSTELAPSVNETSSQLFSYTIIPYSSVTDIIVEPSSAFSMAPLSVVDSTSVFTSQLNSTVIPETSFSIFVQSLVSSVFSSSFDFITSSSVFSSSPSISTAELSSEITLFSTSLQTTDFTASLVDSLSTFAVTSSFVSSSVYSSSVDSLSTPLVPSSSLYVSTSPVQSSFMTSSVTPSTSLPSIQTLESSTMQPSSTLETSSIIQPQTSTVSSSVMTSVATASMTSVVTTSVTSIATSHVSSIEPTTSVVTTSSLAITTTAAPVTSATTQGPSTTVQATTEKASTVPLTTTEEITTTTAAVPINTRPRLINPIDKLTVQLGQYFNRLVPEDTFYDFEDGNTRNLTLSLRDLAGKTMPLQSWIQFEQSSQRIFGLALVSDMIPQPHHLVLIATDSGGLTARDALQVFVNISSVQDVSHRFVVSINKDYQPFMLNRKNAIDLTQAVSTYFRDQTAANIIVDSLVNGSVVLGWSNSSLSKSICQNETIWSLYLKMAQTGGTPNGEFVTALRMRGYEVTRVTLEFLGACLAPLTTVVPTEGAAVAGGIWVATVVPAIVLAVIIFIIAIAYLILHRRQRQSGRLLLDDEKPIFSNNRKPVLLENEMEMREFGRKPKRPVVMDTDAYPVAETQFQQPTRSRSLARPPPYELPADAAYADAFNTSALESSVPPPDYYSGLPSRPPPPYRLPPAYINDPDTSEV